MSELERLKDLWRKGTATADEIHLCKALERRQSFLSQIKRFLLVTVVGCLGAGAMSFLANSVVASFFTADDAPVPWADSFSIALWVMAAGAVLSVLAQLLVLWEGRHKN